MSNSMLVYQSTSNSTVIRRPAMSNCMLVYQSASSQGSQMKPEPITLVTGVTK